MPSLRWPRKVIPSGPLSQMLINAKVRRRRSKNEKLPVYQLPVEILSYIFFICRQISWEPVESIEDIREHDLLNTNDPRNATRDLARIVWDWTIVTLVSHRWREVALSCPGLWSDFHWFEFQDLFSLHEKLRRSHCVPLSMQVPLDVPLKVATGIFTLASRLKELELQLLLSDGDDFVNCVQRYIRGFTMERLQSFVITGYRTDNPVDPYTLPANFLQGATPILSRLKARGILGWNASLLRVGSLTSLELNVVHAPTAEELFDVLKALTNLKELKLNTPLPGYDKLLFYSRASHERVSLPSLELFELETDHWRPSTGLLRNITLPPSVVVSLCTTSTAITSTTDFNDNVPSIYQPDADNVILPEVTEFVKALRAAWLISVPASNPLLLDLRAFGWTSAFKKMVSLENSACQLRDVIWEACVSSLTDSEFGRDFKRWIPPVEITMKVAR
ncbi:hypothetical protein CC1G_11082 [Coprinopsis cinerea okayama7|uniref:Uncharacterized protein n=1 Tax=Coprinopsis cinerea (strain Okayama-7 / 130 / ATCC MYA-4618 / FGSC 9003) TaxID=240176 RepID=A8NCB3_COPC7|nr:hypothetical protein CC1G_11082 [Coprinopsis cinerea okayama7\|eukprot:XP_001832457.1 hypothetical protein CC1G_11082 [Coprinopsis cinerea okayama7\